MDWIVPPHLYVETLTPNVTVSGDGTYTEAINVKRGHKNGVLIQQV